MELEKRIDALEVELKALADDHLALQAQYAGTMEVVAILLSLIPFSTNDGENVRMLALDRIEAAIEPDGCGFGYASTSAEAAQSLITEVLAMRDVFSPRKDDRSRN